MNGNCTFDWKDYKPSDTAVLCFLRRAGEVLLIHKKRGLGAGKINGPGGKVESGETLAQAAIREMREEVGLEPGEPVHCGVLRFAFSDGYHLEVHIFTARTWTGTVRETDEARPFWSRENEIPYDLMWEDDRYWLPSVLAGHTVDGDMYFDGDAMLCWDLRFSDGTHMLGGNTTATATAVPATETPG